MPRDIVIWPDKVLNTVTQPVTDFGPSLDVLLEEMLEACKKADGIGIAANQIGVSLRVAWVGREDGTFFEIVNPEFVSRAGDVTYEEGCLSVPREFEKVKRFERVKVRYQDRHGTWTEQEADGRLAHVFQHEIDHLDGKVFVDHLSQLKRGLIRKQMDKYRRHRHSDDRDHDHPKKD